MIHLVLTSNLVFCPLHFFHWDFIQHSNFRSTLNNTNIYALNEPLLLSIFFFQNVISPSEPFQAKTQHKTCFPLDQDLLSSCCLINLMSIYIRNIFQTHAHCEKVSDHKMVTLLSTQNLLQAVLEFTGRLHSPKTSGLADGRIQKWLSCQ